MDHQLADCEFWLPSEFLNDEDIPMDFSTGKPNSGGFNKATSSFYGYSNLNSPVESVMGSTETESDEEDYLNGLTFKFANTTLHEDVRIFENNHSSMSTRGMAGSPQSTLYGCTHGGSSRGSPNCPSPPATAAEANRNQNSRDLLYAAAGELARMRMVEEAASRYYNPNKNYLNPQPPRKIGNPDLHYQQLQVAQFQKLKQEQIAKQQYLQLLLQSRTRNETVNTRPLPLSSWSTPPGSGMRAVFLGNPTTKRESTGTGVFLPRQSGAPTEPVKKRGCSTVLLPDRVVQALNLNLEAMEDAETMYRQSVMMGQQRRRQQPVGMSSELRLPQEWTY